MAEVFLVTIVEVDKADRIVCQAQGCGHGVYRRIHVVLVDGQFTLLGSDCFQRLYGAGKKSYTPVYQLGDGRRLNDEERQQLVQNTAEFIERLEQERLEHEQNAVRLREAQTLRTPPPMPIQTYISRPGPVYDAYEGAPDQYEGPAMLRWQWFLDRATALDLLTAHEVDASSRQLHAAVTACYAKKVFATPYMFALEVELAHYFPKKYTLRLLHELSLIISD